MLYTLVGLVNFVSAVDYVLSKRLGYVTKIPQASVYIYELHINSYQYFETRNVKSVSKACDQYWTFGRYYVGFGAQ